jgi:hypothetical protein
MGQGGPRRRHQAGVGTQGAVSVMRGLDPRIHHLRKTLTKMMDCRGVGERSDAVLRTAMPGNDARDQLTQDTLFFMSSSFTGFAPSETSLR